MTSKVLQSLKITKLRQVRGIGPKSIAAMAAVNVWTILQLKEKIKADRNWLKETLQRES
jgi:predicted flap endonuclease-1-like 5' DNA nuclease